MVGGGTSNAAMVQGFEVIPLDEWITGALYTELIGWLWEAVVDGCVGCSGWNNGLDDASG